MSLNDDIQVEKPSHCLPVQHYRTANPYEHEFGYSRAVRKGNYIFVSGTTSIEPSTGTLLHPTSAYLQSIQIFSEITKALEGLEGRKEDVVRLKLFVRDDEDGTNVGRAMKEVFGNVKPAATMILGVRFVNPEMRVEIEADAVLG
ncbi:YjgF-like protein [Panaeolus papilionaceus]|nr:YjgF-like protein [Panaeolus papilionaceus]